MALRYSRDYMSSTMVRAATLGLWGLFLPVALTVPAYGHYGLLATTALLSAQLSILGTPQVLVAHSRKHIPTAGLLLHALLLSLAIPALAATVMHDKIGLA